MRHGRAVVDEFEIRNALEKACETRGTALRIAEAFEISPSTVTRWRNGGEIPASMQKLLSVYLLGINPFEQNKLLA